MTECKQKGETVFENISTKRVLTLEIEIGAILTILPCELESDRRRELRCRVLWLLAAL